MTIQISRPHQNVLELLFDRPAQRNALNSVMVQGVADALEDADATAVVIGSTSREAFSAGVDLRLSDSERAAVSRALYRLYRQMRASRAIIISAISGHAVGGGAQIAIASDLRIAAPNASIRFLGPGHGLAVGAWGLPSLVGRGRAADLALSLRPVDASEALQVGLVEYIVDDPLSKAHEYAKHLTALDRSAVSAVKQIVMLSDPLEALEAEERHNDTWGGSVPENGLPS